MSADDTVPTTPAQHADTLASVVDTLLADCVRFGLRPVDVSVSARGELAAHVQLAAGDTAGVDALGGAYGLAADDGRSDPLYSRRGQVTLDGLDTRVTVYTIQPGGPDPAAGSAALAVPDTREVTPVAKPSRVPSERADDRPALALAVAR